MTDHSDLPLGFCQSCGAARIVDGQSHCASCGQRLLQRSEISIGPAAGAFAATVQPAAPSAAIPAPPSRLAPEAATPPPVAPGAAIPVPPSGLAPEAATPPPVAPGAAIPVPPPGPVPDAALPAPFPQSAGIPVPPPPATMQPQPGPQSAPHAPGLPPTVVPLWAAPAPAPAAPRRLAAGGRTPILVGAGAICLVAVVALGAVLMLKPGGASTGALGPTASASALAPAPAPAQSTGAPGGSPAQTTPASTATPPAATPTPAATPAQATEGVAVLRVNAAAMAVVTSWGSGVTVWTTAGNPASSLVGLADDAVGLRDFPAQTTTVGPLFDALGEHRGSWYVCGGGNADPFGSCPSIRVWFDRGTVTSLPGAIQITFQAE